jgi:hypothetical protein
MVSCCEHANEPSACIKGGQFLHYLNSYQLLKDSAACSWLLGWNDPQWNNIYIRRWKDMQNRWVRCPRSLKLRSHSTGRTLCSKENHDAVTLHYFRYLHFATFPRVTVQSYTRPTVKVIQCWTQFNGPELIEIGQNLERLLCWEIRKVHKCNNLP